MVHEHPGQSESASYAARPLMTWVLVLDRTSGDPARRVAGLGLALRLALDAQAAGAAAIVVTGTATAARPVLNDRRLRLPILDTPPSGAHCLRTPATLVVHRNLFRQIADSEFLDANSRRELDALERPVPAGERWGFAAIDVVDARSKSAAERALFRALRKTQDGWTSRYLNRYISLGLSRLLVRTPLSPNQISLGILAFGLGGAIAASRGTEQGLLWGALLLQTQSVLDGCDGEVSRVTYRGSRRGEWLDTIGDDLSNYGYFTGAGWGLYELTGASLYLICGAVIVGCGIVASGLEYRYLLRIGSGDLLKYPLSQAQGSGLLSYIGPLFKRDTFVLLTLIAAFFGRLGPVLVVFAAGAVGVLISVVTTELRLAREGLP